MDVDRGPSCFDDSNLSPCPWCQEPGNYLTQKVKYCCNKCGNPVHFLHVSDPQDPSQTIRVALVKP